VEKGENKTKKSLKEKNIKRKKKNYDFLFCFIAKLIFIFMCNFFFFKKENDVENEYFLIFFYFLLNFR
jgi:hypothetical protein